MYGEEAGGTEHIILVDSDGKVIISGASTIENINNNKWGGTSLTGRDVSGDLQVLTDLKKGALNADGLAAETANVLKALSHLASYNESTWDRWRGNTEITALASATRNSTTATAILTNHNARAMIAILKITARTVAASPLIAVGIRPYDHIAAAGVGLNGTGNFEPTVDSHALIMGQGVAAAVTGSYSRVDGMWPMPLPRRFDIIIEHVADVTDLTYSLAVLFCV